MTCQDPFLQEPQVEDWTTLDFVVAPVAMKQDIAIKGSVFQQAVNTRHLPLIVQLCTRIPNKISPQSDPELDFSNTREYFAQVEADLLCKVRNSFELPSSKIIVRHLPMAPAPIIEP